MPESSDRQNGTASDTATLLGIVRDMANELHPQRRPAVALDSQLTRELGFDSLARVELIARLERAFGRSLPEWALTRAETPRELLHAVHGAPSVVGAAPTIVPEPAIAEEAEPAPDTVETLLAALRWHARRHPERAHITLLDEALRVQAVITYAALLERAETVAARLAAHGLPSGATVAIMLPTSAEYFASFFGVLLAGGIPVPIYPPVRLAQIEEHVRRHARILTNAEAAVLLTVAQARPAARLLQAQVPTLQAVLVAAELTAGRPAEAGGAFAEPRAEDIAFLQYTSGTTADPKGVILTHAQLLANIRAMGTAVQADSTDVFVSWLPLYHDMGLIGAWFGSLYYGVPLYLMSPFTFLLRPRNWLAAIHRYRATLSAGPNFAFELCLRKIEDRDLEGLDLGSLRLLFNGAEPVSPTTLRRFIERFSRYGLRPEAVAPVYGLAECAVGLAFPPLYRAPLIDRIRREPFTREGKAIPAPPEDAQALEFVACGRVLPGHEIRIVDAAGRELPDREEGRLEFRGPSATSGYYRNREATRRLIRDGWLDSGDLAYTAQGDIYITGRIKDIIIRAGRNIYPHELEEAIGDIPGIRKGCVAVFGSRDPVSGTERLIVLAETRETQEAARERLRQAINSAVVDLIDTPPDDIVLAPPHSVLKTSSGKIRRAASRELYESGQIGAERPAWWQLVRLAAKGLWPELRRFWRAGVDLAYGLYALTLFAVMAPPVWLLTAALPRPQWSLPVLRVAGRVFLALAGARLKVEGRENLPAGGWVLVANHASYLDGIVLTAVLPGVYHYVAKREFVENFVSRVFLEHLGTEFVERFDKQRGVSDARRLADKARAGTRLVFFPEGTFVTQPGLMPFRMGAFVAAAEAGVPVIPVAIRGTRTALRGGQWLPRRSTIHVVIGRPILPTGSDWQAALRLRDTARAAILEHCGEADLALRPPAA